MLSKVQLLVDLGYAFDYYSILEIKKDLKLLKQEIIDGVKTHLISQLTLSSFTSIINSEEYKILLESNKQTFDAVERARYGTITAKEVDDCNMLRYNAKINLQKAFALDDNEAIIEIKS
jgi:hypothetical protein